MVEVVILHHTNPNIAKLAFKVSAGKIGDQLSTLLDVLTDDRGLDIVEATKYPQVLEHLHLTMLLLDVPHFVVDHLVRHRHLSWIVQSLRHSTPKKKPCIPERVKEIKEIEEHWRRSLELYRRILERTGEKELARLALPPIDCRTVLVSGNLRAFLEMICFRTHAKSQLETREVVEKMLEEIDKVYKGVKKKIEEVCYNMYKYRIEKEE